MRVLHVISSLDESHGGPAVALSGLAAAQRAAGLDVDVLAAAGPADDTRAAARLRAAGVGVDLVGPVRGPLGRHPDLWPRARGMAGRCDVAHVHALWEDAQHQAARACRAAGTPYV